MDTIIEALTVLKHRLQQFPPQTNPSLFSGNSGLALLYWSWYKHTKDKDLLQLASTAIGVSFDNLDTIAQDPSLADGYTGLAWLLRFLDQQKLLEIPDQRLIEAIDSGILQHMYDDFKEGNYDPLYGFLGTATYLRHRSHDEDAAYLEDVTDAIKGLAIQEPTGTAWKDVFSTPQQPFYNLGLSHGTPGIIVFLAQQLRLNPNNQAISGLLEQACAWLLQQEKPLDYSLYPTAAGQQEASRLGWSFGDAGVAWALASAAQALSSTRLKAQALRVALHAASRDINNAHMVKYGNGLTDAGFCNGSAGAACMFRALNSYLPHPALEQATNYWLTVCIDTVIGLQQQPLEFKPEAQFSTWMNDYSLIKGLSGTALALLSFLEDGPKDWLPLFMIQ